MKELTMPTSGSDPEHLVTEAIKRILVDVVVRGHGERLIGRKSSSPELSAFIEQVPYMLDRINQLHLVCSSKPEKPIKLDAQDNDSNNHHHHFYHHRHRHSDRKVADHLADQGGTNNFSSLHHFINLIGDQHHWLVRTRDALGLTPLHKAVLAGNRPIVEYILDRYPNELASGSSVLNPSKLRDSSEQDRIRLIEIGSGLEESGRPVTLIDAQDKYGRTALHYAAATGANSSKSSKSSSRVSAREGSHLYHLLVRRGASLSVRDFRGKTAPQYLQQPKQVRFRSIIHLANKLNAAQQARVLSKTLRLARANDGDLTQMTPISDRDRQRQSSAELPQMPLIRSTSSLESLASSVDSSDSSVFMPRRHGVRAKNSPRKMAHHNRVAPVENRESMSVSCGDLRHLTHSPDHRPKSKLDQLLLESNNIDGKLLLGFHQDPATGHHQDQQSVQMYDRLVLKQLIADRCAKVIIDDKTKQQIRRTINDGTTEALNELIVEGYGSNMVAEASVSCWNLQNKRYLTKVCPDLLINLDEVHELIARDKVNEVKVLLEREPILARIRRPYRRASMNALHLAVQLNRDTIIKFLVSQFPELVLHRDSHGATCLHWAARSLKQERTYFWLLELFGRELEQLTDFRGKTASDYRCQLIKSMSIDSTVDLSHSLECKPDDYIPRKAKEITSDKQTRRQHVDVRQIMKSNQRISNTIQATGTRIELENRKLGAPKSISRQVKSDVRLDASTGLRQSSGSNNVSNSGGLSRPDSWQSKSVESDTKTEPSVEMQLASNDLMDNAKGAELKPSQTRSSSAHQHPSSRLGAGNDIKSSSPRRFSSDSITPSRGVSQQLLTSDVMSNIITAASSANILIQEEPPTKSDLDHSNDSSSLLNQMTNFEYSADGQVDCEERPKSGSSSSRQSQSRPGSSSGNVESIITDCIERGDLAKLEHLIIAGSGQRIIRVYCDKFQAPGGIVQPVVKEFIEIKLPDYMDNISQVHSQLHNCFALATYESGQESVATSTLNQNFNKLSKLLVDRKQLIMSRDRYGATALDVALLRCDQRLINYLIRFQPEAAGAPDHDNRNALHYTALALSCLQHHGPIRLVRADVGLAGGYWQLDESLKGIYENLITRYGDDLLRAIDRSGCTPKDYLDRSQFRQHYEIVGPEVESKVATELIGQCCPEFSSILDRYCYEIIREPSSVTPVGLESLPEVPDQRQMDFQPQVLVVQPEIANHLVGVVNSQVSRQKPLKTANQMVTKSISTNKQSLFDSLVDGKSRNGKTKSTRHRPSQEGHSIVGGVIVPTIIHNDQMAHIETYDIIYRRPTSGGSGPTGFNQSERSRSRTPPAPPNQLQGAQNPVGPLCPDEAMVLRSSRLHLTRMGTSDADSGASDQSSEEQDGANEDEDEDDDEDDDGKDDINGGLCQGPGSSNGTGSRAPAAEQVRQLSTEFESRVKREKDELRVKVDQMMAEIKLSAKSARSSRLLASPLLDDVTENGKADAITEVANKPGSLSSSGLSSCSSTSNGSASTSCSSSSHTSGCSSSSAGSCSSGVHPEPATAVTPVRVPSDNIDSKINSNAKTILKANPNDELRNKNAFGQTYLHFIASRGQSSSTLYRIMEHASQLMSERDIFYRTARGVAVQFNLSNNVQTIDKFLIDQFIAGNTVLLRRLLNEGYSPLIHVSDADGNDIMLILKLLKLDRMIHVLLQMADFQRWRDELHTFIRHGYSAGVSELIKKHQDILRAKSAHSRTSLHLAVLFDQVEIVKELLAADPSCVHLTDNMGRTPLHYTYGLSLKNVSEIRDRLIQAGASLEARDVKMRTPKYYFIFKREIEDIRRLELELY